ncbi:Putative exported protein [Corynebacterium diphtheriae]|uniref:Exported protein n=1 Tax=Corynebacterium diphtheriae (strain ATCC 700971 / NCTC 13129 / Biotype gravis) TaxID=257309 RepID=Q6NEP6_CORDI|nr:Putative exported protein [Corynebacterium diphtheriae]
MLMMDMVASAVVIGHIAGATIVQPMATVRAASDPIIRDVIACLLFVWFCGGP